MGSKCKMSKRDVEEGAITRKKKTVYSECRSTSSIDPSAFHGIPPPIDDLAPSTRQVGPPPASSRSPAPPGSPAPFFPPTGPKRATNRDSSQGFTEGLEKQMSFLIAKRKVCKIQICKHKTAKWPQVATRNEAIVVVDD